MNVLRKSIITALAVFALAGCGGSEEKAEPQSQPLKPVDPTHIKGAVQHPREYWRGYEWCRRYRELGLGPADEVGGDFYHDTGDSPTFEVASEGCHDGYERRAPAVPMPDGFEFTEEPEDFEEAE
jgi:hypothetical protein